MANANTQQAVGKGRHASSIKRHRQSLKRKDHNKTILTATRTAVKKVRTAVASGNKEMSSVQLKKTISALSKAASKGVIPKKRASRLSSRLSASVNKLG